MLKMRPEQMDEFARNSERDFEDRLAAHLRECFPEECAEFEEDDLLDEIAYGMRRAEAHGFESELDVCRYVDLMFAFGAEFDTARGFESLQAVLYDESIESPTERMDRLYEAAMQHLEDTEKEGA